MDDDDGQLISRRAVAQMFGVDARTVTNWQRQSDDPLPVAITGKRGTVHRYNIRAVHEWGVRRHLSRLGACDDGQVYDLNSERSRLTHHQANKTALEEAILAASLIPAETAIASWQSHIASTRAKLLGLPTKMARLAVDASDLHEIESGIRECVYEALVELSEYGLPPDVIGRLESGGFDLAAAAGANCQSMGGPESPAEP